MQLPCRGFLVGSSWTGWKKQILNSLTWHRSTCTMTEMQIPQLAEMIWDKGTAVLLQGSVQAILFPVKLYRFSGEGLKWLCTFELRLLYQRWTKKSSLPWACRPIAAFSSSLQSEQQQKEVFLPHFLPAGQYIHHQCWRAWNIWLCYWESQQSDLYVMTSLQGSFSIS